MTITHAENLTDDEIDAVYDHFENGAPVPEGIILDWSFTRTMGRFTASDVAGTYQRNYTV